MKAVVRRIRRLEIRDGRMAEGFCRSDSVCDLVARSGHLRKSSRSVASYPIAGFNFVNLWQVPETTTDTQYRNLGARESNLSSTWAFENLAARVEWTAQEKGDGLGYDIQSFDDVGKEIFIEEDNSRSKDQVVPANRERAGVRRKIWGCLLDLSGIPIWPSRTPLQDLHPAGRSSRT